MNFKTPKFWHKRWSIISILLIPVSWLYRLGHRVNMALQGTPYKSSLPVICVGNAIAGGSGKTPSVMALIKIIKDNDLAQNPVILTRGYGSNSSAPMLVNPKTHGFEDVGDEALLLAQHAPTVISKNRADGAKFIEGMDGADLIIMDDGMQNNRLHKDINFFVIDRQIDFGNNRILPAGPLREPLSVVLDKTQAILCIGRAFHSDLPVFESQIAPKSMPDSNQSYVAFAGLGYPEKFKNTLLDHNINLTAWYPFPDHYAYTQNDEDDLKDRALNKNAQLITTEKDYVRLSRDFQKHVMPFAIELQLHDSAEVANFLKEQLEGATC